MPAQFTKVPLSPYISATIKKRSSFFYLRCKCSFISYSFSVSSAFICKDGWKSSKFSHFFFDEDTVLSQDAFLEVTSKVPLYYVSVFGTVFPKKTREIKKNFDIDFVNDIWFSMVLVMPNRKTVICNLVELRMCLFIFWLFCWSKMRKLL